MIFVRLQVLSCQIRHLKFFTWHQKISKCHHLLSLCSEEEETMLKSKRLSKKISLTKCNKGKENGEKGRKFDQVMKLIYIASNYDINQFVCHDVIQEILKNHGMRSLFRDWKYALASVLFYIIYPLAYFVPFLNQYLNHPTINQLLPIWGITLCIPFFVWHGYWNSRIEMQSVSYKSRISQNFIISSNNLRI